MNLYRAASVQYQDSKEEKLSSRPDVVQVMEPPVPMPILIVDSGFLLLQRDTATLLRACESVDRLLGCQES